MSFIDFVSWQLTTVREASRGKSTAAAEETRLAAGGLDAFRQGAGTRTSTKVRWPSGLRRQLKALVRKGVGSNPTLIILFSSTVQVETTGRAPSLRNLTR